MLGNLTQGSGEPIELHEHGGLIKIRPQETLKITEIRPPEWISGAGDAA